MVQTPEVDVVIPAWNEEDRVRDVVCAAAATEMVRQVILVDDGSSDDTLAAMYACAEEWGAERQITVLSHKENRGKGEALHTGITEAEDADMVVALDADLHGLVPESIELLTHPIAEGGAKMTLGVLERPELLRWFLREKWAGLSGQRAIDVPTWHAFTQTVPKKFWQRFGIEASLSAYFRHTGQHRKGIRRVELPGVTHTGKREKNDTWREAATAYMDTYSDALIAYGRVELHHRLSRLALIGAQS